MTQLFVGGVFFAFFVEDREVRAQYFITRFAIWSIMGLGLAEIAVEFHEPVTAGEARAVLREAPGVVVQDVREDGGYTTPIDCVGEDATYVSRIRKDPTVENGLQFWCVSDNLRKGAALNAVHIAELVVAQKLLKAA